MIAINWGKVKQKQGYKSPNEREKEEQQFQNDYNAAQAQKQMDFQERMSNTAHQREAADLRAAGFNPALTAGAGASSPAGMSYSSADADPNATSKMIISGINAAANVVRAGASVVGAAGKFGGK